MKRRLSTTEAETVLERVVFPRQESSRPNALAEYALVWNDEKAQQFLAWLNTETDSIISRKYMHVKNFSCVAIKDIKLSRVYKSLPRIKGEICEKFIRILNT